MAPMYSRLIGWNLSMKYAFASSVIAVSPPASCRTGASTWMILRSPTSSSGTAAGMTVTDAPFWYWPPTPIARMSFSPW